MPQPLELLAPARNAEIGREAILHGADAVYIGGPHHGARAAASNSTEDIAALAEFAHIYGARVYVTLNTIIYDNELAQVSDTVRQLYRIGVDALIVQDMSLLRADIPPIDLHASTQCDIRTPQKAAFLASCGFSQLVLPREFSLSEIQEVSKAVPPSVRLEAFVHGALCVSYSGDCQASCATRGRSANRGECAQLCRLSYNLVDGYGSTLLRNRHLLSLRDLNRLADLRRLADAGITSFKIEGRLKDAAYVKNVVLAYRRALDKIISDAPHLYCRASYGDVSATFTPNPDKAFNRGFTSYFIDGRPGQPVSMANTATPKWVGEKVARVVHSTGKCITVKGSPDLANGDGLGYYDKDGSFCGFRLNRVDGNRLYPASPVDVAPGTLLYRNNDTRFAAALARDTATRLLPVEMKLGISAGSLWLRLATAGRYIETSLPCDTETARSPQKDNRRAIMSKLGGTPFKLGTLADTLADDAFIPASTLAALRRKAVELLTADILATHLYIYRRPEDKSCLFPASELTYHDNVANDAAEEFYRDHGVHTVERAMECGTPPDNRRVMTTRYCLRRELGACLRTPQGKKLPRDLYLENGDTRFRLEFDCNACRMHLYTTEKAGKTAHSQSID